jgi:uncharacterized membrane protein
MEFNMNRIKKKSMIPTEKKRDTTSDDDEKSKQHLEIQARYSGPLPPPKYLEEYNRISPGSAEKIIIMAEKQSEHRRRMEEKFLDGQLSDAKGDRFERKRGQIFGFIISVVCIFVSGFLAIKGYTTYAVTIGGGTLISLVSLFILGRKMSLKQILNKEISDNKD